MGHERLTAQDALFLDLETATQPMHVGAIARLHGDPLRDGRGRLRLADLRERIERRLHVVPRFRQRLLPTPMGVSRPVWVDDHEFDITRHVLTTRVAHPGDAYAVDATMTRLQSDMLDRSLPLWQMWFVDGLEDGDVAMVFKAHHAMVDGIAGVAVAAALMDFEPDVVDPDPPEHIPEPHPLVNDVVMEGVADLVTDAAGALRRAAEMLRQPGAVTDRATTWGDTLSELAASAPAMRWNGPLSSRRAYARCRVGLDEVKRVRAATGTTTNDVVLAVCADALGRYLVELGEVVDPDLVLRAVIPASVRADHEHEQLGNRVAVMLTDLPVGEPDARRRLERVAESMSRSKLSGQAQTSDQLLQLARFGPGPVMGQMSRLALRHRVSNVTITNIPGPDVPLYCMGAELRDVAPYVGLLDNHALTIGVISYRDHLGFGLVGEPDLTPDLSLLADAIVDATADLVDKLGE